MGASIQRSGTASEYFVAKSINVRTYVPVVNYINSHSSPSGTECIPCTNVVYLVLALANRSTWQFSQPPFVSQGDLHNYDKACAMVMVKISFLNSFGIAIRCNFSPIVDSAALVSRPSSIWNRKSSLPLASVIRGCNVGSCC